MNAVFHCDIDFERVDHIVATTYKTNLHIIYTNALSNAVIEAFLVMKYHGFEKGDNMEKSTITVVK